MRVLERIQTIIGQNVSTRIERRILENEQAARSPGHLRKMEKLHRTRIGITPGVTNELAPLCRKTGFPDK